MMRKLRFITVGLGPVGRALTAELVQAGHKPVWLVGRARKVERESARKLKAKLVKEFPEEIDNIDLVLLTLPTSAVASYAKELSRKAMPWKKLVVIHAAGSYGIVPLEPLAKKGCGVAAMHPYQTFPKSQHTVNARGITYGITGNRRGSAMASRIARDLGGVPLKIREQDRLLYHLSAILACTFVAANVEMAARVLRSIGVSERQALQAAIPIAGETIRNVKELGIRAAMTGPQMRRDKGLVEKQMLELRKRDPELAKLYNHISEYIMRNIATAKKK